MYLFYLRDIQILLDIVDGINGPKIVWTKSSDLS